MADAVKSVAVVEYDPAWPAAFRALARRAAEAIGERVMAVEHVGSTSVPGLAAKPVVDLSVVVRGEDVAHAIERLAPLGYVYRGEQGIPGRHAFRSPPREAKHHLYVCVPESPGLRDHLLFRDHLRAHPDAAAAYAALKRRLATEHRDDRDAYQQAKSAFIEAVTRRAEAEGSLN
ncbi:MAG TPA: GrpB family protein [Longimicrobium sp.]|nr:GrpB family protein [Longimicrobium sp.]